MVKTGALWSKSEHYGQNRSIVVNTRNWCVHVRQRGRAGLRRLRMEGNRIAGQGALALATRGGAGGALDVLKDTGPYGPTRAGARAGMGRAGLSRAGCLPGASESDTSAFITQVGTRSGCRRSEGNGWAGKRGGRDFRQKGSRPDTGRNGPGRPGRRSRTRPHTRPSRAVGGVLRCPTGLASVSHGGRYGRSDGPPGRAAAGYPRQADAAPGPAGRCPTPSASQSEGRRMACRPNLRSARHALASPRR